MDYWVLPVIVSLAFVGGLLGITGNSKLGFCCRFWKGLTHSLIHHLENVPFSKKLQTTTEMGAINSLPNDKILDKSKFKTLANDKLNVTQMLVINLTLGL